MLQPECRIQFAYLAILIHFVMLKMTGGIVAYLVCANLPPVVHTSSVGGIRDDAVPKVED